MCRKNKTKVYITVKLYNRRNTLLPWYSTVIIYLASRGCLHPSSVASTSGCSRLLESPGATSRNFQDSTLLWPACRGHLSKPLAQRRKATACLESCGQQLVAQERLRNIRQPRLQLHVTAACGSQSVKVEACAVDQRQHGEPGAAHAG